MTNVLITGASGMLGNEVVRFFSSLKRFKVFSTSRSNCNNFSNHMNFDLTEKSYTPLLEWSSPELIIHCAAMTNVDQCESEKIIASAMNTSSVEKFLNYLSINKKSRMFFISSDAIKADNQPMATEDCKVKPVNYYGYTKAEAEKLIIESRLNATAIRTTIVGSKKFINQKSFSDSIIENLINKKSVDLFEDVYFTPICCFRLASCLLSVSTIPKLPPILNIAGAKSISKFEFGYELCKKLNLDETLLKKTTLKQKIVSGQLIANRIHDQSLSSKLFEKISKMQAPTLADTVDELVEEYYG